MIPSEILWFVLAFAATLGPAAACLGRQSSRAEALYGWLLAAEASWVAGQAMELLVPDLQTKLWLDGLQYVPMCGTAALAFAFAHAATGRPQPKAILTAFSAAAGILSFIATNPAWRGWVRADAHVMAGVPFATLEYRFGPLDLALILGFFVIHLAAVLIVLRWALLVRRTELPRVLPLLFGFALPPLAGLVGMGTGARLLGQRDISFAVFGLGGALVAYSLKKQQLRMPIPVAQELAFERIPDAAIVLDRRQNLLDANQAARTLLGVDERDLATPRPVASLIKSDFSWPRVLVDGAELEQAGQHFQIALHKLRDVGVDLVLLRNVTTQVAARRVLEKHRDSLAEQVERDSALIELSELKIRALFDSAFQLMGILDPSGRVLEANQAALRLAQVTASDVIGRPFWETAWWEHSTELQDAVRTGVTRATQGEFVRFEAHHRGRGGELRYVDFSLKPVVGPDENVIMLIAEGRDITEMRLAADEVRQAQKMEALGRLAGGVAHDFNNLLTVVSANIALVLEEAVSPQMRDSLEQSELAAKSAAALTAQLLAFGRKNITSPRSLDVSQEVTQLQGLLTRLLPENISIDCAVSGTQDGVLFDETQFRQILLNLALNARDAMPGGGKLSFRTSRVVRPRPGGKEPLTWVQIEVSDTGGGMTAEQAKHVFEPFFTTKTEGRGIGLGLSIVYGAVTQAGGYVEVESSPGRGSRFQLHFPLSTAETPVSAPQAATESRAQARQERVYLVEDEPLVRRTISKILNRSGYTVTEFASASELVESWSDLNAPDLVLSDTVMPGISGYELVQRIRSNWPHVPLVLMSGYAEDPRVQEEIARGVAFLAKPFSPQALLELLARTFGSSGA